MPDVKMRRLDKNGKQIRLPGEPNLPKARQIVTFPVMVERDPACLVHPPHPFDTLYPDHRPLDWVDFDDPQCTCKWEANEPKDKGTKPRESKRICPTCHQQRSLTGACWC